MCGNGRYAALSRRRQGFESPWGRHGFYLWQTCFLKLIAKSVQLHDSGGLKRLFTESLDKPKGKVRSRWAIDPNSTFLIRVERDSALDWGT